MSQACPYCGADVIEGADVCDECQHSLTDMSLPEPTSEVERGLLRDLVTELSPHKPLTVPPTATIGETLAKMVAESIGCIVVADGGKMVGIFTERDALLRVNVDAVKLADRPISSVMTPNPATLRAEDKIALALQRMNVGGYRHLPILDGEELVGVISIRDILNYLTEHNAAAG
ncbi:MAG: CBS domain-containing protein [Planctomycetaceae bacterium]|nr:CBS domain-containing protein [Planctomycetaceae bacterium]